jgi:2-dehydro-3-deoxygalactonokinase
VQRALDGGGLLHNAFSTRTLALFERVPPERLVDYLSGLVIGEEIRQHAATDQAPLWLVGADHLGRRYQHALSLAGLSAERAPSQASWSALWRFSQFL